MEQVGTGYEELFPALKGSTSVLIAEQGNTAARMLKEFRKESPKPILKAAYIDSAIYIGDNQLDVLTNIKSKNELIGELVGLLQSPARNVISALQSGGSTIAGLVKTLESRAA
jgi:large subunit ribosomal protein L10